jgi:hypothetical protein
MRKKSVKRRWPYFFGQQIHGSKSGNLPELIKPESGWPKAESVIEDILRWADDGGKMLDLENHATRPDLEDTWKRRTKR